MYLGRCYREKDGKRYAYWALVENYRTARGPRQRVVAWLGVMDERGRLGVKRCAVPEGGKQADLFVAPEEPEWVEVDLKEVRVERTRRVGGPWFDEVAPVVRNYGHIVIRVSGIRPWSFEHPIRL